jgi:hypothetical protein
MTEPLASSFTQTHLSISLLVNPEKYEAGIHALIAGRITRVESVFQALLYLRGSEVLDRPKVCRSGRPRLRTRAWEF